MFIKTESARPKPLRAAVAPTAMPNAIMPGSTGSASKAPKRRPASDQSGLAAASDLLAVIREAGKEKREH